MGKGKKMKIVILFLQWSKCIPINLKRTPRTFNGTRIFTFPTAAKCEKITIFDQNSHLEFKHDQGSIDHVKFLINCYNNSFSVTVNAFWPWQKQNSDFWFWPFPPWGYIAGLRWWWGLKTHLKFFLMGILFKRGQVEHILTMANLKLKPSLFMPCPKK